MTSVSHQYWYLVDDFPQNFPSLFNSQWQVRIWIKCKYCIGQKFVRVFLFSFFFLMWTSFIDCGQALLNLWQYCFCFGCMLRHIWLFVTLWTGDQQAPLSMGFSRQEYWSGSPCPPPGNLSDPGIKLLSLTFPALAGRFFTTSATWEA